MKASFWGLKELSILSVIAIITISYGLFFYFQSMTENEIRSALFQQQEQRQLESTKAIAQNIESDLDSLISDLRLAAQSPSIQSINDPSSGDAGKIIAQQMLADINTDSRGNPAILIDKLQFVDRDDIIAIEALSDPTLFPNLEGVDMSSMEHLQETRSARAPVLSKGFEGVDGHYRIAITYPIIDESGEYLGAVAALASASTFFQHYGNIYDIESQYLAVLDTESVQLVHPVDSLVGTPFFGEFTQQATGRTQELNTLVGTVLTGEPAHATYEFMGSERLTSGYPIFLGGQAAYFVFVITPTSTIYANVGDILYTQRIETFALLAATTAAILVLIIVLAKWNNNLRQAVKETTEQLVQSNEQLSVANERLIENFEQLQANEKMQKEFINIAAHELRTPVQPIIGLSDMLLTKSFDPETRFFLETIHRNALRLQQLSSDILDVTRIEAKSMRITKSTFDIVELVQAVVAETSRQITSGNLQLVFHPPKEKLMAVVDKDRIHQVLSNLLNNAVKFTEEGVITVSAEKIGDDILVKVIDTGLGVDQEIAPRLFTKFASMSEKGTGLGLFISKSIIDAHGGKIWFENNKGGKGAIFGFSLPAAKAPIERTTTADD